MQSPFPRGPSLRQNIALQLFYIQRTQRLSTKTLHLMIRCLNKMPLLENAKFSDGDMDLLAMMIVKIASDRTEDARYRSVDLWPDEGTFMVHEKALELHLKAELGSSGPLEHLEELFNATVWDCTAIESAKTRANGILEVSLFNEEMKNVSPERIAATAYYVALCSGPRQIPWVRMYSDIKPTHY
jgi:hypothetical protein